MSRTKHLVTGGSGFLGNLVAKRIAERGEQALVLDVWEDPNRLPAIDFVNCSVMDREGVARAMKGIDVVHHTAALVPLTKSGEKFTDVNVEGSKIVAEEAAKAGVKFFVHISSSAIFGKCPSPVRVDSPTMPAEIYGVSKLRGEQAVRQVSQQTGMPLISIRPRTILGEGRLGIFQILFEWIMEGISVYTIGDGTNKIQFLHASDLIDAYFLIIDQQKPGMYNLGTDRYNSLNDCLGNLIKHAGTKSKVRHLPKGLTVGTLQLLDNLGLSPLAPWHYLTYGEDFYFDVQHILDLGWKPKYSNDQMLIEAYDNFVAHYHEMATSKLGSPHRKRVKEQMLWLLKQIS